MSQPALNILLRRQEPGGSKDVSLERIERQAARDAYLDSVRLGWYQVTLVFFVWSVVGLLIEEAWIRISMGLVQSRAGLVWGPLSPLYGTGAVLLTLLALALHRRGANTYQLFTASMITGGLLEQVTGWTMETFMGAVSWDYITGGIPGALTKWVCVPYLIAWGVLGCLWGRIIMPDLLYAIGEPNTRLRRAMVALLGAFLATDVAITLTCFARVVERKADLPPSNPIEQLVDARYDDTFVARRFQNMEIPGVNEDGYTNRTM